jgi:hypothetical protein
MTDTFDPFASFQSQGQPPPAATPGGPEIDFDQFVSTLESAGWNADNALPSTHEPPPSEPPNEPPPPTGDAPPEPTTPPAETVRIGDKDVPLAEVTALYELGRTLTARQGASPPAPPVAPVTATQPPVPPVVTMPAPAVEATPPAPLDEPPDFIDKDDPTQMGVWNLFQQSETRRRELEQRISLVQSTVEQQQARRVMDAALTDFRQAHPTITDDEIDLLGKLAAPTVDAFIKTYGDPVIGVQKAMYHSAIEYQPTRDRVLGINQPPPSQTSAQRKGKLSSLAGSSGSGSREPAAPRRPSSDREAKDMFATALAESFQSNGRLN